MKVFGVGRTAPFRFARCCNRNGPATPACDYECTAFIRINVHLKIFSLVCVSFHSSQMPAIGSSVPSAALMK
jgi:hypothetical protein